MKTQFFPVLLWMGSLLFLTLPLRAQDMEQADSTGLPGDNFSLEGAIELFKKANSLEEFEKMLNTEDNYVNNLDLNEDGEIDYIRVIDNMDGDAHAIVLQAPVSESESQDIAVIEIEKQGDESAILQIVGNEDIFGEQVIAEPAEDEMAPEPKRGHGPSVDFKPARIVVNVWLWPSVRFVYRPGYAVWVSPWRWHYYPNYWRPWRPHPWAWYHVRVAPYRRHVHVVTTHRVVRAHTVYTPRRTSSKVVHTRTTTVVSTRKHGTAVGQRSTTTTTTRGRQGNTTTTRTTTTRAGHKGRDGNAGGVSRTTTKTTRKRGRG